VYTFIHQYTHFIHNTNTSGTALPGTEGLAGAFGRPKDGLDEILDHMQMSEHKSNVLRKLFGGSTIEKRHSVSNTVSELFFGKKGMGNDASIDLRNELFLKHAPKLAIHAAEKVFKTYIYLFIQCSVEL
jgi:predicted naringenin-chalcone synthase